MIRGVHHPRAYGTCCGSLHLVCRKLRFAISLKRSFAKTLRKGIYDADDEICPSSFARSSSRWISSIMSIL
jgi:hypothetical protein